MFLVRITNRLCPLCLPGRAIVPQQRGTEQSPDDKKFRIGGARWYTAPQSNDGQTHGTPIAAPPIGAAGRQDMAIGKTTSGNRFRAILLVLGCILLLLIVQGIFLVGKPPSIDIGTDMAAIGKQTPFRIEVSESRRGLTYVKAELVQGDKAATLVEKEYPASWQFMPWGSKQTADALAGTAGVGALPGLQEGTASLRVTAGRAPTWLRRPDPQVREILLPVRLTPPSLQVTSSRMYISQGGCELVTYRVGETAQRDGVQAGPWWFPGYPLPGGGSRDRFALFAAPYDTDSPDIRLIAADDAGNESRRDFLDIFKAKSFREDTFTISDAFIAGVVAEIIHQTAEIQDRGNPLENFLAVNRDLRLKNDATIKNLAQKTRPEFLWSKPFLMLPNGKVTAAFGDRRTYRYQGETVDRQTHLGYDLASTQNADIPSPNDGVVVLAGLLGIYGNTVVIDHGYGLMTISGHLSSMSVEEGQRISRGDIIGRTGATGLAGGDHLHYGTLLQGLPVNPVEWSDGHWIRDRIASKLGPASPFSE